MANLMLSWQQAALLALGLGVAGALLRYAGHVAWAWRWGVHVGPFLREAGVVLLEPIMRLEITVPEDNLGDIVGDLQQRRAMITHTQGRGNGTVIEAQAPLASLFGYSNAMRGLSQGRATCSMEPASYGPAPPEVLDSFM